MVGVENVKIPRPLAIARHVETTIIKAQKPRSDIDKKSDTSHYNNALEDLEKNPPCNAEDNLRAGLIIIEAWFGGY